MSGIFKMVSLYLDFFLISSNYISVMACKVIKTSSGGCTHFITTPDPEGGVMTVGFGQGVVSVI